MLIKNEFTMQRKPLLLSILIATGGCNSADKFTDREAQFIRQIDSLNKEVEYNKQLTITMNEVGELMDSIDFNRDVIRLNVEGQEGLFEDYVGRMKDLNHYIKATSRKINEFEKTLKNSDRQSKEYLNLVRRFKQEISEKTQEAAELKRQIETFKVRNKELEVITTEQQSQISEKDELLTARETQLNAQKTEMRLMQQEARKVEGEAFYKAGEALETAARRTHLAPKKKKETLREALELFKKASALGNENASVKIQIIEQQL